VVGEGLQRVSLRRPSLFGAAFRRIPRDLTGPGIRWPGERRFTVRPALAILGAGLEKGRAGYAVALYIYFSLPGLNEMLYRALPPGDLNLQFRGHAVSSRCMRDGVPGHQNRRALTARSPRWCG
jgi:hypothetical protein